MNGTGTIEFKEKTERGIREGNRWLFKHSPRRRLFIASMAMGYPSESKISTEPSCRSRTE